VIRGLLEVLEEARVRGLLGPGPLEPHVRHATTLAALAGSAPASFLDLGSGAGVPGLVIAGCWPEATGVLLDAQERRCRFLDEAVARLGLSPRIRVECARAEVAARRPELRGAVDLVVARAFGPPAVTAECAVGFLSAGGRLVVSEPPGSAAERWPAAGIARLGLSGPETRSRDDVTLAVLTLTEAPEERWPRRPGIPAKRPLWDA
jgi:16S rRNA (guanine527-N7)-methyltransferase